MNWSKNTNEPEAPEVLFSSEAPGDDDEEILYDLWIVVARLIERRTDESAPGANALLAFSNATNGVVDISWMPVDGVPKGEWKYTVELPRLHEDSSTHDEGAFYFDQQVRSALFSLAEDLWNNLEFGDGLRDRKTPKSQRAITARQCPIPMEEFFVHFATEMSPSPSEIIV